MTRARIPLALVLACAVGSCAALEQAAPEDPASRTPARYRRPADQTYLTYPEWFLVFSPEEYADYVEDHTPSRFPFLEHVAQLWEGYAAAAAAIPDDQPTNYGYHAMVVVISTSSTVEYVVRAGYESLIGRVTEASAGGELTAEDRYGAEVARDYERFLRQHAWYDFDYVSALRRLWLEVPFTRTAPLRAAERRYWLTTEYLFKIAYAQLLASASDATFDDWSETTAVVLDGGVPDGVDRARIGLTEVERWDDGAVLCTLPRYEAFTPAAAELAAHGARFVEVAGNRGAILVSARAPRGVGWRERALFRQPIATDPARERVLLEVPVAQLGDALREIPARGAELEHVFDY